MKKALPEAALELFDETKKNAQHRYATYKRMAAMDYSQDIID